MTEKYRRKIGDVTYCLGTAYSFIRICPVCGHERFRSEPDNPLEYCWEGHGPLEVLTTDNLERYKALWDRLDSQKESPE